MLQQWKWTFPIKINPYWSISGAWARPIKWKNDPIVNLWILGHDSCRMTRTDFWKTKPNMEEFFPEIGPAPALEIEMSKNSSKMTSLGSKQLFWNFSKLSLPIISELGLNPTTLLLCRIKNDSCRCSYFKLNPFLYSWIALWRQFLISNSSILESDFWLLSGDRSQKI